MKIATWLSPFVLTMLLVSALPGRAGESTYERQTVVTTRTHSKSEPGVLRVLAAPFVFLGRAAETVLHSPQLLSEGIMGDRPLVGRHGILAPRDIAPEDRIVSAEEDRR
jgi:hypothetical protein